VGIKSGRREELRSVALDQKILLLCILFEIVAVVFTRLVALPSAATMAILVLYLIVLIVGVVVVFRLALKMYSTGVGILMGILALIPCLGLLILFIVNQKATMTLARNGVTVGFLGANLSQFRSDE
jgi:hypothetical protein